MAYPSVQETTMKKKPATIRPLASEYLLPALQTDLRAFHRVSLAPTPDRDGEYTLGLDPNFCSLDPFGEPLGCTRMAMFGYQVQLERLQEEGDQTLYAIESKDPLPARMRLVIIHAPKLGECPARLMTLDDAEQISGIVHLHPTDHHGRA
jgi:hypothetical protein